MNSNTSFCPTTDRNNRKTLFIKIDRVSVYCSSIFIQIAHKKGPVQIEVSTVSSLKIVMLSFVFSNSFEELVGCCSGREGRVLYSLEEEHELQIAPGVLFGI